MKYILKNRLIIFAWLVCILLWIPVSGHAEVNSDGGTNDVTFEDLEGKRAGVLSGTPQDEMVYDNIENPQVLYYNNFSDLTLALQTGKIDYFVNSTISYRMMRASYPDFIYIDRTVRTFDIGTIFPMTQQGKDLCTLFNQYIAKIKEDGTLDQLKEYWLYPNDWKSVDIPTTGENGILKLATCSFNKPFAMVLNGTDYAGFDIEIIAGFCKTFGYGLTIDDTDFTGMTEGIAAGKYDLAAGQISWTAERAEKVLYSDFYCTQEIVPIINAKDYGIAVQKEEVKQKSFWSSMKESFYHTFIEEARWKTILIGIRTTLFITFFGFLLANIFGGISCMMAMSKNKFLKFLADVYSRLMQGLPIVVILMLLYYIVFKKINLSGTTVSIIGFGLAIGAHLEWLFESAIRGVDPGQWEATLALGFTKKETFFGIILPQAIRGMLPGYFSQIITLMKGTAVVGYIAVVDLTKAGDIVRSATYDAFFPLMNVALVYFVISWLLLSVLKIIQKKLEPKRVKSKTGGKKA